MPPKRRGTKRKRTESRSEEDTTLTEGRDGREPVNGDNRTQQVSTRRSAGGDNNARESSSGGSTTAATSGGSSGEPGNGNVNNGGMPTPLTREDIPGLVREIARQLRTDNTETQVPLIPGMVTACSYIMFRGMLLGTH